MIQVDNDTVRALREDTVFAVMSAKLRSHDTTGYDSPGTYGEDFDISEYLLSFPSPTVAVNPYLGGITENRISVTLDNSTGKFTPGKAGGFFENRNYIDRFGLHIEFTVRVLRHDSTYENVPVFTGWVRRILIEGSTVNLDLASRSTLLQQHLLKDNTVIDRWNDTPSSLAQSLAETVIVSGSGTWADATWAAATTLYRDIDWVIAGEITSGTRIYDACTLLAKSGMAAIVPLENGQFRWLSMFPESEIRDHDLFPDVIDKTNAWNWGLAEAAETTATRVDVIYQDVSVGYPPPGTIDPLEMGEQVRYIGMPYLALARCAMTAAYMLHERYKESPAILRFTMGAIGTLIQVGDRVPVRDPYSEAQRVAVIVSKTWSPLAVGFEAVVYNDEANVIQRTFDHWDTSSYGGKAL